MKIGYVSIYLQGSILFSLITFVVCGEVLESNSIPLNYVPRVSHHANKLFQMLTLHQDDHIRRNDSTIWSNILQLKDMAGSLFTLPVRIGTPSQNFDLAIDTGSTNTWVTGIQCTSNICTSHAAFNSSKSSTYNNVDGSSFLVAFGTGSIEGVLATDTIAFGRIGGITLAKQVLGIVHKENGDVFMSSGFSGIVGLALPQLAALHSTPLLENIAQQQLLKHNIYSLALRTNSPRLILGTPDPVNYIGNLSWFPLIDEAYWAVTMDDIHINGKSIGLCEPNCIALLDSGTTFNTIPRNKFASFMRKVDVNGDCNQISPDITIIIGGIKHTLTPDRYVLQGETQGTKTCTPQFMAMDATTKNDIAWILGENFMRSFFVSFDYDNKRVGIAQLASEVGLRKKILHHLESYGDAN